jgi:uncharacterized protein
VSPAAPAPVPRWAFGSRAQLAHALLLVVLLTAVFAALRGLAARMLGPDMGLDVPSVGLFAMLGLAVLVQAGAVVGLGLVRWARLPLAELGWHSSNPGRDCAAGLVGFLAVAAVVLGLRAAEGGPLPETLGLWLHQPLGARAVALCIGLLASFNEESVFRGYLQKGLVARLGPAAGILLGAAVFALYHGNFQPVALLGKTLLGLVFGLLAFVRQGLLPGALAHLLTWGVMGFT